MNNELRFDIAFVGHGNKVVGLALAYGGLKRQLALVASLRGFALPFTHYCGSIAEFSVGCCRVGVQSNRSLSDSRC